MNMYLIFCFAFTLRISIYQVVRIAILAKSSRIPLLFPILTLFILFILSVIEFCWIPVAGSAFFISCLYPSKCFLTSLHDFTFSCVQYLSNLSYLNTNLTTLFFCLDSSVAFHSQWDSNLLVWHKVSLLNYLPRLLILQVPYMWSMLNYSAVLNIHC